MFSDTIRLPLSRPLALCIALCLSLTTVGACSEIPEQSKGKKAEKSYDDVSDNDPLEPFNRAMFEFNHGFDTVLLRPITYVYRNVVPDKGQEMASNFLDNLYSPVYFGNSVLQADPKNSFATLWRFIINTTVGVGGLFDPSTAIGLKARRADFGETLALYGADTGPYLVLPLIGPSSIRDGIGRGGDVLMNPITYVNPSYVSYSVWGASAIDMRNNNWDVIDSIYRDSLDPYATLRSGYTQKRNADIRRARAARQKAWDEAIAEHSCHQE